MPPKKTQTKTDTKDTATATAKNKGGRPRKEIDFDLFEKLCNIQCTQSEICSVLGVDDKTLTARLHEKYNLSFSELFKRHSENGKTSLRRTLFEHAQKNPATAIFLAKNLLGYRDQPEVTAEKVDGIILVDPEEKPKAQKENNE